MPKHSKCGDLTPIIESCERGLRDAIPGTVPIIGLPVARHILEIPSEDFENLV
jgi:hypothetical protein